MVTVEHHERKGIKLGDFHCPKCNCNFTNDYDLIEHTKWHQESVASTWRLTNKGFGETLPAELDLALTRKVEEHSKNAHTMLELGMFSYSLILDDLGKPKLLYRLPTSTANNRR